MPRIDWAGAAVLILAAGLGLGFVAAIMGISAPIDGGAQLLNLIAGGMVAIVAGYVARIGPRGAPPAGAAPAGEGIGTPPGG